MKIRIAIADDHTLFRKSLAQLLEDDLFVVKILADNGKDLLTKLAENPDVKVVLLDINMPVMNGFEATQHLKINFPDVKILVLTMSDDDKDVIQMIKLGAHGYLLKDTEPIILKKAIREVVRRGYHYSELVSGKLANTIADENGRKRDDELTRLLVPHELEYIRLTCNDLNHREIAERMDLSPRTIDGYRDHVFAKLQLQSRVGLVMFAIKHKLFIIE